MELPDATLSNESENAVLPGFRFYPTDEELLSFYLRHKIQQQRNLQQHMEIIPQLDIYKFDPWDLPRPSGASESFFFCARDRKYRNSVRPNRVAKSGFWKATGRDRHIYKGTVCLGLKKSLVYYHGKAAKCVKSDWIMHELRLPGTETPQETEKTMTVCRVFRRNQKPRNEASSSASLGPDVPMSESSAFDCFLPSIAGTQTT